MFCQSEMSPAEGPLTCISLKVNGLTGHTSKLAHMNFAPEKSLRNERHPRLLDYQYLIYEDRAPRREGPNTLVSVCLCFKANERGRERPNHTG